MRQDGKSENAEFTCKYYVASVTFEILKEWGRDLIGWHFVADVFGSRVKQCETLVENRFR